MGCCYSKKVKEYDEIISTGTEKVIERLAEKFDMLATSYNAQSYIWKEDEDIDRRTLN